MDKAGDQWLLQHSAKGNLLAVSEENADTKQHSNLSAEDKDGKENLCQALENGVDFSAASRTMVPTRRARKGRGCNLRNSLAWNKAFFTEEGVLDPSELSMLNGSATKPNVSFLRGINEEISPLTSYSTCTRVNLDNKVCQGSAFDDRKHDDLFSTLEPSGHMDSTPHMVQEKATLSKGICRSIPRAPAVSSQKRLANTSSSNPASKLPKFAATKSQTSSLTPTARCSVPTKRHSHQTIKPANVEQSVRSKDSSLTLKKALNYPTSSSRSSEYANDKKTVNETSKLPSSAGIRTLDMGKCISDLRMPQGHLPPSRLPRSVGNSNFEKVAHSFSQNAPHMQGGFAPAQGQAKPSCLKMPSPSLGFFCQAKVLPHGFQLQKESQKSGACDYVSHSLKRSYSLKHTDDLESLHTSHGQVQPDGSDSTGTKVSSIIVSTPFSSKKTDFSDDFVVPCVTNPTLSPDISQTASERKILTSSAKPDGGGQASDREELHCYCLMGEGNTGKQSGFRCEPESPNDLVSVDSSSLIVERKFVDTLTHTNHPENAGGTCVVSECSGPHQLVKSNFKQLQQGDCRIGEPVMCQLWEDTCETSISAGNECLPGEKHDLFSGLSFGNTEEVVGRCPLLEIETPLESSKMQIQRGTSLQLVCSSTENVVSSVEGENAECSVHDMGQHGLNNDTILLDEAHRTETSELQDCGVSLPRKNDQIALQDANAVVLNKQGLMEKLGQAPVLLNQLKAAPFSDEWFAALEYCGEDILQVKTGAVQNSPPDKPTPELGPWSPVKRKNQDIGPYDCTKYTKSPSTASPQ